MVPKRTIRIYYVLIAAWSIASLIFAGQLASALEHGTAQFLATLLILIASPALPALWLWLMERSPWRWQFIVPVIMAGVVVAILLGGNSGKDLWFVPIVWSAVAGLGARLLKPASQITSVSWKQVVKTTPPTPVVIDHGKYIRLLDDQVIAGFPSVMRVRAHFAERLPVVIATLRDYGPVPGQQEFSDNLSVVREFMLGKAACELAFLCALTFFERMCGPDFRYTKQYQSLISHLTEIDAVADVKIWKGQFEDLSRKAATGADLTEIVKVIDRQKERDKAVGRAAASDNVTIAICSLIVLVKRGLLTNNDNQAANSDFTKMTTGAMNQMRETFARQMTQLSV